MRKLLIPLLAAITVPSAALSNPLYRTPQYDSYSPDGLGAGKSWQDNSGNIYRQQWRSDKFSPIILKDEKGKAYQCNSLGQCSGY